MAPARGVNIATDDVCTGTNGLTLGQGTTPQPVVTDNKETGRAELWRLASANPVSFDIHFRVIHTVTSNVVLQSDCYRLLVRD